MNFDDDFCRKQLLSLDNIIKTENGYERQKNYYVNEDGEIEYVIDAFESDNHQCEFCVHGIKAGHNGTSYIYRCHIYDKLYGIKLPNFKITGTVLNCEAYEPIEKLNIINDIDEMYNFVEKTYNIFDCPEDHEQYYGFERKWDEETGEELETIREYINRGGTFKNIPDKYPCVIYFNYGKGKLEWIYIGEDNEEN